MKRSRGRKDCIAWDKPVEIAHETKDIGRIIVVIHGKQMEKVVAMAVVETYRWTTEGNLSF